MHQLDHFTGRNVKEISGEKGNWAIILDGDAVIRNHDGRMTPPDEEIVGLSLLTVALSELDTRMVFGRVDPQTQVINPRHEVTLNPNLYGISTAGDDEETFPQRSEGQQPPEDVPPTPEGRDPDGPSEEYFGAIQAREAELAEPIPAEDEEEAAGDAESAQDEEE